MKEIYLSRKTLFLEVALPLFVAWALTFSLLIVVTEYLAAIIVSCVSFVLFLVFCLFPIKSWLAKICFDENGISKIVGHKVKKSISWNELRVVNFVKAKRRSIVLKTSIDSSEYIGMPCNSKNIEILAEYIHKAVNAKMIGVENLSQEQLELLKTIEN